jgi:hypothetical protein
MTAAGQRLNFCRGKAHHRYAFPFQPLGPALIAFGLVIVSGAIDFDAELESSAVEVDNVGADKVLTPEVPA